MFDQIQKGFLPFMGGYVEGTNFVVEKSPHGKSIERLIPASTDAAVVHVSRNGYAQTFFATSVIIINNYRFNWT